MTVVAQRSFVLDDGPALAAGPAPLGPHLEPVEILITRDHVFKKKPKRYDERQDKNVQPPGCVVCNGGRWARPHLGAPPSLNDGGSGMDRMAYQVLKGAWQRALAEALDESPLPRGLWSVTVEVLIGFGKRRAPDEGNLRWMIEKALGDALVDGYWELVDDKRVPRDPDSGMPTVVTKPSRAEGKTKVRVIEGGWLPSDSFWPVRHYSMGNLEGTLVPGESWTRLVLFPRVAA